VQTENTLLEGNVAIGASDAGIYVVQSRNVFVRNNRAEFNVAGFEIEEEGGVIGVFRIGGGASQVECRGPVTLPRFDGFQVGSPVGEFLNEFQIIVPGFGRGTFRIGKKVSPVIEDESG